MKKIILGALFLSGMITSESSAMMSRVFNTIRQNKWYALGCAALTGVQIKVSSIARERKNAKLEYEKEQKIRYRHRDTAKDFDTFIYFNRTIECLTQEKPEDRYLRHELKLPEETASQANKRHCDSFFERVINGSVLVFPQERQFEKYFILKKEAKEAKDEYNALIAQKKLKEDQERYGYSEDMLP